MKSQKHNVGELVELTVKIEKQLAADLETMVSHSELSKDEIVVIALKRFRSAHADYMDVKLDYP
jgi:allophanate hydrolase subunit 1